MMQMTLHWSKRVTLLIDSWETDSWLSYILSLLVCLMVSAFYQYLESLRFRLKRGESPGAEIRTPLLRRNNVAGGKVAEAVLFGVDSAIGYLLMLAIMSFNGGVFLAIVVGLMLGYFFFRCQGGDASAVEVDIDDSCACA